MALPVPALIGIVIAGLVGFSVVYSKYISPLFQAPERGNVSAGDAWEHLKELGEEADKQVKKLGGKLKKAWLEWREDARLGRIANIERKARLIKDSISSALNTIEGPLFQSIQEEEAAAG